MSDIWIVAKPGGFASGRYELPMFGTYFNEAEARAAAVHARAALVMLPVTEDYRDHPAAASSGISSPVSYHHPRTPQ